MSSTVQNHQGTDGGGIWTAGASTTTITGSTIQQNRVTGSGAGIYMQGGTVNLNNSLVDNNTSEGFSGGGGVYCNGTLNVQGSTISNNMADGVFARDGGGIRGTSSCNLTIDNATISGNRVLPGGDGAGVYTASSFTITNSTISGNQPTGASFNNSGGGGLYFGSPTNAMTGTISNTRFENNLAGEGGGFFLQQGGSAPIVTISDSSFIGNQATAPTATSGGGGAINNDGGDITVIRSLFDNNSAAGADGGGIFQRGGTVNQFLNVYNSTFSGNASRRGAAIYYNQTPVGAFVNNTIASNTSTHPTPNNAGALGGGGLSSVTIQNSALANNTGTGGNCWTFSSPVNGGNNADSDGTCGFGATIDPQLAGLADNGGPTLTHALLNTSPALDAADAGGCGTVGNVDQRGVGRGIEATGVVNDPQAGDCDIGAFEFGAVLPTLSFDVPASAVDELAGPVPLNIGFTLSNPAGGNLDGQTVDVFLQISGTAANGTDYTLAAVPMFPATLVIPAAGGTTVGSIDLSVIDDVLVELDETAVLTLVPVGPVLPGASMSHTVTITSDDVPVVSPVAPVPPGTGGGGVIFAGGGGTTIIVQGGGFDDAAYLAKTVDRTLAAIGDTVTFTINANNPKDIPLTQVVIKDVLDSGYENPVVQSASMGNASVDDNTVTVSGFTLQPGETMELVISAQVSERVLAGSTLGNIASLESPDASVHFSNAVEVFIPPNAADLFFERADDSVPIISPGNVRILPGSLPSTGERQRPMWPFVAAPIVGLAVIGGGVFVRRKLTSPPAR